MAIRPLHEESPRDRAGTASLQQRQRRASEHAQKLSKKKPCGKARTSTKKEARRGSMVQIQGPVQGNRGEGVIRNLIYKEVACSAEMIIKNLRQRRQNGGTRSTAA